MTNFDVWLKEQEAKAAEYFPIATLSGHRRCQANANRLFHVLMALRDEHAADLKLPYDQRSAALANALREYETFHREVARDAKRMRQMAGVEAA